jgi:hypothetical protein
MRAPIAGRSAVFLIVFKNDLTPICIPYSIFLLEYYLTTGFLNCRGSATTNWRGHVKEQVLKRVGDTFRSNARCARDLWGELPKGTMFTLKKLSKYGLSVCSGDLKLLNGQWYITHSGLLGIAQRRRCSAITTSMDRFASDTARNRWVFKARVFKVNSKKAFASYGDADPSNVSPFVRGAEMRVAETRAVNRALRKAYGIGLCSVEELGWSPKSPETKQPSEPRQFNGNGHSNGQPRLRDQLCLLICRYKLDPNQVKAYAAHFCGTETLKDAGRDLVQSFISHLAASAKEDRDGLICKLKSFAPATEAPQ